MSSIIYIKINIRKW